MGLNSHIVKLFTLKGTDVYDMAVTLHITFVCTELRVCRINIVHKTHPLELCLCASEIREVYESKPFTLIEYAIT